MKEAAENERKGNIYFHSADLRSTSVGSVLATVAKYYNGSIEALYGAVDAFGPAPDTKARVDVLSIEGTAAVVRVTLEDWHGLAFTDFHNLIKENGQWKIIAKVFHQYQ